MKSGRGLFLSLDGLDGTGKSTQCRLLAAFMQAPGRVWPRERLLDRVADQGADGSARAIDVHVKNLRRKIDAAGAAFAIDTIHGTGYRLQVRDAPPR